MKVLVLCNSDWLAIPAINQLHQQGLLAGVVVPAKSAGVLIPALRQIGIAEKVYQVEKKTFEDGLRSVINECNPDAGLVFTFPWKIPGALLQLPVSGFINFHFGLLPQYKGTDPVFWQLKNGETNGGISVHIMNDNIDEGPLLFTRTIPIIPGETYGMHCQRLGMLAPQLLAETFETLKTNNVKTAQSSEGVFLKAPAVADLTINWQTQAAEEIERLVNAANPKYGGAVTKIKNANIQLLEVAFANLDAQAQHEPGTIIYADAIYGVIVACKNGQYLQIKIVRFPEGYISGTKLFSLGFKPGDKFS